MVNTPRKGARWTKEEDALILKRWGFRHPEAIAKALGRTLPATKRRAYMVCGTKKMNRGGYSVRSLSEETGYHYTQIKKSIVSLGLENTVRRKSKYKSESLRRWGKGWDNRTWLITDSQAEKILEWLSNDSEHSEAYKLHFFQKGEKLGKWSRKHDSCIECGTVEKKHYGKGLCYICRSKPYLKKLRKETTLRRLKRRQWWDPKRGIAACKQCDRDDRNHHAGGLCDACYQGNLINKKKAA